MLCGGWGTERLQAVSMTRGAHKPSGGKLMYVNNLNRVICAATTVLTDKGQSANSVYMLEDINKGCKEVAKS